MPRRKDSVNVATEKQVKADPVLRSLREEYYERKRKVQDLLIARNPELTTRELDVYIDKMGENGLLGIVEKRKGPTYWADPDSFIAWYNKHHRMAG